MNLTAERNARNNAAISALGSLFETDPGDGCTNETDMVIAARVLRSGWIRDYFFSISGGGVIVRYWRDGSPDLPAFSGNWKIK